MKNFTFIGVEGYVAARHLRAIKEIEFSGGFFDLHTKSYENIVQGGGFGLDDANQSIQIVHQIRNAVLEPLKGDYHPMAKLPCLNHPFKNGKRII